MSIYDLIIKHLLINGPIISLFQFCADQAIDYSWGWKQVKRAQERDHIKITRINKRGCPDRIELTKRGILYFKSNMTGGA